MTDKTTIYEWTLVDWNTKSGTVRFRVHPNEDNSMVRLAASNDVFKVTLEPAGYKGDGDY